MSTLGIVAITAFVVLFTFVMLAFAVYLAWAGLRLHRTLTDTHTSLSLLISTLGDTLKSQSQLLEHQIASLDGQKLLDAARANLNTCKRIETACLAFSEVVKTLVFEEYGEWRTAVAAAAQTGVTPEGYAPDDSTGDPYVTRSRVTADDITAMARQESESTSGS